MILKHAIHGLIFIAFTGIAVQLTFMYLDSAFASENPMKVSLAAFVESQAYLPMYSFVSLSSVYLVLSMLFVLTAVLLYTSIYFVISLISDLQR